MADPRERVQPKAGNSCLLPLIWMFGGHLALVGLLLAIAHTESPMLSGLSVGFWIVVGLVVGARYVDVKFCAGTKTDGGTPATLDDVWRFGRWVGVIAGVGWAVVLAI